MKFYSQPLLEAPRKLHRCEEASLEQQAGMDESKHLVQDLCLTLFEPYGDFLGICFFAKFRPKVSHCVEVSEARPEAPIEHMKHDAKAESAILRLSRGPC